MEKRQIKFLILGIALTVLIANIFLGTFLYKRNTEQASVKSPPKVSVQKNSFSYQGVDGSDGLTLLKEKATVEQDNSGLVVSINSRKADGTKKEFWAFYVNGEMAQVGPAEFITKDKDTIEWKIETY